MAKTYQWRAATDYRSTTDLSWGVTPSDKSDWQTATPSSTAVSGTWTYWYRDANVMVGGAYSDANSSRVAVSVTDSWTATIDNRNYLTVTLTTTLNSIVRDDLRGSNVASPGRQINVYTAQGGTEIFSTTDNSLNTAHTILGTPIVVSQRTLVIPPESETSVQSSLYYHNATVGLPSYDDIWLGVQFKNPLPKDYRPGSTYSNGAWHSHNRDGGWTGIWDGSSFKEMRTYDGAVGTDNPPLIKHSDAWKNQRLTNQ